MGSAERGRGVLEGVLQKASYTRSEWPFIIITCGPAGGMLFGVSGLLLLLLLLLVVLSLQEEPTGCGCSQGL